MKSLAAVAAVLTTLLLWVPVQAQTSELEDA